MKKEDLPKANLKKGELHPILAMLPDYLKDHNNYDKIQRAILDAGATKHTHSEVADWAGCTVCQGKQRERLFFMKKLGFQNAAQYKAWQQVQERIKKLNNLHEARG